MKISIVTPNFNGEKFLEQTMQSVLSQRDRNVELEYIVVDACSRDGSMDIINRYRSELAHVIVEKDRGPFDAINKGFALATGEVVAWLNADDLYCPDALHRVAEAMAGHPEKALCFGHCPIINEKGEEIRVGITRFKEMFFPVSSRFMVQSINYISQPATFFRRKAVQKAGPLSDRFRCAWDYDFITRVWRHGGAQRLNLPALSQFRWHEGSLSGRFFRQQFREEWEIAAGDAGRWSPQTMLHLGVRWGIVGSYSLMAWRRAKLAQKDAGLS
jgi:glycosyltransferase involved in cell wall biosynthesis